MRIGMVGLGKMGGNMSRRLLRGGHEVVGFAPKKEAVEAVVADGGRGAGSLEHLVSQLEPPRVAWAMVPAGAVTDQVVDDLAGLLEPGDVVVDGGNTRWTDSLRHADLLRQRGIGFADAGTSGGVWGLSEGYCLMVGADDDVFATIEPALRTLAPEDGYAHVGGVGAGHFVKMVHNGIEYALMQGYAEGFALLEASAFDLDLRQVAAVWRHGSVVRSWLLDLAESALSKDPELAGLSGWVEDSGEGRWTVEAAVEHRVPAPTIAASLFARFSSRRPDSFENRLVAALRREFGGHAVKPPEGE